MNRSAIVRVAPGEPLEPAAAAAAAAILGCDDPARHPDYEVKRPDGNIFRVGLVEEIVFRSVLAPIAGRARVVAVLEPERMSDEAANLLLKTLEEPPPSLHMIFVTARPFDLPATIRSRCRVVEARRSDWESPLLAAGMDPADARRLAFLAGSGWRAEALIEDAERLDVLEAWARLPGSLTTTPASCLSLPGPVERLLTAPSGDEETRRRQRRERTDELLHGLSVLAWFYREVLARSVGARLAEPLVEGSSLSDDSAKSAATGIARSIGVAGALDAIRHIRAAREAILANGSARLALEALLLRLGGLGVDSE